MFVEKRIFLTIEDIKKMIEKEYKLKIGRLEFNENEQCMIGNIV